jgi:hypothetical protein
LWPTTTTRAAATKRGLFRHGSASKHLPTGLTLATVDAAKAGDASASQAWSQATAAAQSGDMATATATGTAIKAQVIGLMKSLNMQLPAGA